MYFQKKVCVKWREISDDYKKSKYFWFYIIRLLNHQDSFTTSMFSFHLNLFLLTYLGLLFELHAAAAAKSLQSCPTLCDPIDGSPPGSPVPLQARTMEWVAISFSSAWKWKVKAQSLSRVRLLETPWTAAHQAPPSMGFSRQEYWSGVPLHSPFELHT